LERNKVLWNMGEVRIAVAKAHRSLCFGYMVSNATQKRNHVSTES
jgi:hypothetical protein